MQNIDYRFLRWFTVDVDSTNRSLYRVNVGSIVNVSEVHAAPTFRIVVSRVSVHEYKGFGPTDPLTGSQELLSTAPTARDRTPVSMIPPVVSIGLKPIHTPALTHAAYSEKHCPHADDVGSQCTVKRPRVPTAGA
jgi:hypothetical protein